MHSETKSNLFFIFLFFIKKVSTVEGDGSAAADAVARGALLSKPSQLDAPAWLELGILAEYILLSRSNGRDSVPFGEFGTTTGG